MAKLDKRLARVRDALESGRYDAARRLLRALPVSVLRTAEVDSLADACWRLSGEGP